ncbi:transposable element Tcb2 transposase [Trichonephila clavipes]|nr:transposable element Tcb2 transposase [Trichonephila clavipes]
MFGEYTNLPQCNLVRRVAGCINWPLRSPNLNHIENLLNILEQGVRGHPTASMNLTELWTTLANIWQAVPVECFQKLVESMLRRVVAIIKARGGPTRY